MPKFAPLVSLLVGLLAYPLLAPAGGAPTTLRVEVVDDSDDAHSPYILLVGKDVAVAGGGTIPMSVDSGTGQLAQVNASNASNSATPTKVSELESAKYSIVSPYTGKTRMVRYFTVTTIGSGGFYVFKNDGSGSPPFTYTNNVNPSAATSNFRFDLCELTFNSTIQSDADLTSIDAFSIPMQFELFDGVASASSSPIDGRYYYLSTTSMLSQFQNIGAGQALLKLGPTVPSPGVSVPVAGWTPADGMSTFVRALGPGQEAAPGNLGVPAPYPSFAAYLATLVAPTNYAFSVAGNSNGSAYDYNGTVQSDGHNGYQIVLTGTTVPAPTANSAGFTPPANAQVTIHLPVSQLASATANIDPSTGQLSGFNLAAAGSGYNNPPTVTIAGPPEAVTATGTAILTQDGNSVQNIVLNNPGTNYYTVPNVTVDPPSGGGTTAVYSANISNGVLTHFTQVNPGSGYTSADVPNVHVSAPPPSVPATATANVVGGAVTGFSITQSGAGYTNFTPTVTITPPAGSMDTFLYGATLSADAFSVAGMTYQEISADTNIVYGSITRDALGAINFGYMNGKYGTSSLSWYGASPTAFPFGLARTTNDGYYNSWAALLYNFSDAYSFAFSDRSGPSPDMILQAGQTLRITILPDNRLDSPRPRVTEIKDHSLKIEWPAIAGATGYVLTVVSPSGIAPVTLPASAGTNQYELMSLHKATPYTFTVAATGTANGQDVITPAQSLQVSTSGSLDPVQGGSLPFNMAMSWVPPANIAGVPTVSFNDVTLTYQTSGPTAGQWLNNGVNASLTGNSGLNEYVMTLKDGNGDVLFTNNVSVILSGTATSFRVSSATLYGNVQPLTAALMPPYGTSGNPLTLSVPYVPIPLKSYAPPLFPGQDYAQWVAGFPGISGASSPADDPDGDGLTNLQEFYQDTDPEIPGLFQTTSAEATSSQLVFHYRKSRSLAGVKGTVEWSTDLQTWQTDGVSYDPDQDVGDHLECTARIPIAGEERVFARLRVELDSPPPGARSKLLGAPHATKSKAAKRPMSRAVPAAGGWRR